MAELAVRLRTSSARAGLRRTVGDGRVALGVAASLVVGSLAFSNGGYFPVAWGWAGLALLWVLAVGLALDVATEAGRRERIFVAAVAALAAWMTLSLAWTGSVPRSVLELERMLVYLAAAAAAVLLVRRSSVTGLLLGVLGAVTLAAGYGLATRLFPDQLGVFDPIAGYQLSEPVGYWNAFAVLAAMGTLIALGLAARGGPVVRCLAGGSTVLLMLTLYFTYSRGGWVSLFVGLAAAIAVDRRRLQLVTTGLVLLPWTVIAIWAASTSPSLTRQTAALGAAARDGHGLAVIVILLIMAAGLAMLVLDWAEEKVSPSRTLRSLFAGVLLFVVAASLIVVFGRYGLPPTLARKAYDAFNTSPKAHTNLNQRLFSLSGSGRNEQFHTAWQQAKERPLLGGGPGTFDEYWFQHRRVDATVHDAHNLYLETLAELGIPGLLLLLLALGVPLSAVRRARSSAFGSVALAAYVAFLVHASIDWDWEMPAITLTALFAAVALMALARTDSRPKRLLPRMRWPTLGVTALLIVFALVGLLGNMAVSASSKSTAAGRLGHAQSQARRASDFAPWSSEPWRKLGEAQVNAGHLAAARDSFRKAIAKDPRDWTLHYELALASRGAERRAALAAAARLNPLGAEIAAARKERS